MIWQGHACNKVIPMADHITGSDMSQFSEALHALNSFSEEIGGKK